MRLSRILLPIDLSERSAGAARHAKVLASHFHAELILAHVFELQETYIASPETAVDPAWYQSRENEARRALNDFQTELFRGLTVRRVMLHGDVAGAIVKLAHEEHVDLIVMPTHGYGPFRRFIVGSVTAKVLHDADCPVWTGVHIVEAPPIEPMVVRRVLCAVDFDAPGRRALHWAAELAAEFGAGLSVVHAVPGPDAGEMRYFDQALPAMLVATGRQRLEDLQKDLGTVAERIVESGSPPELVRRAAIATSANLLVIGRHESPGILGRLRANAYAIIRESPCPVVSV
jgi:nucleotide-binding universal stress UspA family protein